MHLPPSGRVYATANSRRIHRRQQRKADKF